MKNIKFRGKGIADDEWYYGDLIQSHLGTAWIITENYTTATEDITLNTCASPQIKQNTLGQYTGLRNKNGKEIYEGDKVELDEEIGIIEWNNESSRFVIAFDTWATDFDHEYGKDLEIVGTIYDNADLLEKESD